MKHAFKPILISAALLALTACGSNTKTEPEAPAEEPLMTETPAETASAEPEQTHASILYLGHAGIRITTPEDKIIYIDPYAPGDYSAAADLILVTHDHYDHNNVDLIQNRADDCTIITSYEALADGKHQSFDLGYAKVQAVEAGNNPNHSITECVGYVITLSDGKKIYVSGDTSTTEQMSELAEEHIDIAFICCDGQYNMGIEEAGTCAETINAGLVVPYHTIVQDGIYYSRQQAEALPASNKMCMEPGETFELS